VACSAMARGGRVDVAVDLKHQRARPVPLYDQGGVDRWQGNVAEPHVDDGSLKGDDRTGCGRGWIADGEVALSHSGILGMIPIALTSDFDVNCGVAEVGLLSGLLGAGGVGGSTWLGDPAQIALAISLG